VLECLAERTIALAQKRKMQDPQQGYDPFLERRIESLLPLLVKNNIRLITNMGAANPVEAAKKVIAIAKLKGIKIKVAAVTGDDVLEEINQRSAEVKDIDNGKPLNEYDIISANAYIGVEGILQAIRANAQVIITGRVADPSLFLAPIIYEFGWKTDDYDLMGKGTVIGHLMECAGQVTGGYFADPLKKPVENIDTLGHPFADVFADGSSIISKVAGTGGIVNLQTAKEQLLYEVINPHEYFTPDVIADFTTVKLKETGKDQVHVSGGTGKAKPSTYKVSVGYKAFYLGEGEISYAGPAAYERAVLAGNIIEKRLKSKFDDIRIDYIGLNSTFRKNFTEIRNPLSEIRLRIAGKSQSLTEAALIGEEVESLYTNGPAGGGGVRKYTNEVIGIVSVLMERNKISPQITVFES
jgi:hypothetical protein